MIGSDIATTLLAAICASTAVSLLMKALMEPVPWSERVARRVQDREDH
jgi:hypothetical protein